VLTIVPTPIGNLQDITARCLSALRSAEVILCEDTRRTLQLYAHFGLSARLERYNEHDKSSLERALDLLRRGKKVVLVSDGGTPCISDPGWRLVAGAFENNIKVEALPGPCAAVTAAACSGFPVDSFVFLGFLPRSKSKIEKILRTAAALGRALVIYESPYRLKNLIETVCAQFGCGAMVCVGREITKVHEEWIRGTAGFVLEELKRRGHLKGEISVVVSPLKNKNADEQNKDQDV